MLGIRTSPYEYVCVWGGMIQPLTLLLLHFLPRWMESHHLPIPKAKHYGVNLDSSSALTLTFNESASVLFTLNIPCDSQTFSPRLWQHSPSWPGYCQAYFTLWAECFFSYTTLSISLFVSKLPRAYHGFENEMRTFHFIAQGQPSWTRPSLSH